MEVAIAEDGLGHRCTAHPPRAFQYEDGQSGSAEQRGRHQPVVPASDDDRVEGATHRLGHRKRHPDGLGLSRGRRCLHDR